MLPNRAIERLWAAPWLGIETCLVCRAVPWTASGTTVGDALDDDTDEDDNDDEDDDDDCG